MATPAPTPPGVEESAQFELHHYARGFMLPIVGVVVLCFSVVRGLHRRHKLFIPESGAVLLIGAISGGVISIACSMEIQSWSEIDTTASLAMNFVLLPILIFQAGWTLNIRDFWAQIGAILSFAVAGTAISAIVIYWIVKLCAPAKMGWHEGKNLEELTAFASMISAVDPVATLTTFQSLGVERFLNIIVLGEALINDAVALVLFEGFNDASTVVEAVHEDDTNFLQMSLEMLWQLCGSSGLGIILAHMLSVMFSYSSFQSHEKELATVQVLLCPFILYSSAAALHLSGIISTLFGSAVMGVYVRTIVDEVVREQIDSTLEALAHLSDLVIFAMVGLGAVLGMHWVSVRDTALVLQLSLLVFGACLVGRAVAVGVVAWLRNRVHVLRRRNWDRAEINEYWFTIGRQVVMWWGGGLRGAIALVCALEIQTDHKAILVDVTMVNIFLTVLIFGSTTSRLVKWFDIPLEEKPGTADPLMGQEQEQATATAESMARSEPDKDTGERAMYDSQVPAYQKAIFSKVHHRTLTLLGQGQGPPGLGPQGQGQASSSSGGAAASNGATIEMETFEQPTRPPPSNRQPSAIPEEQ